MSRPAPFEGLAPSPDREVAAWVTDALRQRVGVGSVVPDAFAAYARLHHRLDGGLRWIDVAPQFLERGLEIYAYPYAVELAQVEGDLGAGLIDALVPLLAGATNVPERCHYALWDGWGWTHAGSHTALYSTDVERRRPLARFRAGKDRRRRQRPERAVSSTAHEFIDRCPFQPGWGGRDMRLFDGPATFVDRIGWEFPDHPALNRQGPQWWWPDDRAWFVATDIDQAWSYVGGPSSLIDTILTDAQFEAVGVAPSDLW